MRGSRKSWLTRSTTSVKARVTMSVIGLAILR
jgi:hypothetical protein